MPKGYELDGHILELKRNLYGMSEAPMNFFNHLKQQLEKRGFQASAYDLCLFMNNKTGCIMLTYVDDCILFHRDEKILIIFTKYQYILSIPKGLLRVSIWFGRLSVFEGRLKTSYTHSAKPYDDKLFNDN